MATLDDLDARVTRTEEHRHQTDGRLEAQSFAIGRVYEATQEIRSDVAGVKSDVAGVKSDVAEVKATLVEILARLPERK